VLLYTVFRRDHNVPLMVVVCCATMEAAAQRFSLQVAVTVISLSTYEVTHTIFFLY
jgi:hypothetical protein